MSKIKIEEFFNEQYRDFAQYDNYRKICSLIDGQKPSGRKILYTVIKTNVNSAFKVSQLKSRTAELTNYMHGEDSLEGVTVGLAQDFVGSNNIPLLRQQGNFGTRLDPVASAGRYIYTCKEKYLDKIFHPDDFNILIEQVFEGDIIEPKFFVPVLPLSVLNPTEGISVGFADKILPRNIDDVIGYIKSKLDGKNPRKKLLPYYENFNGTVVEVDRNKFEIIGVWNQVKNKIIITEVPICYDRKSYEKHLIKLEDKGIIKDFKDLCDDESFKFEVSVPKDFLKKPRLEITDTLGLIQKITENLTYEDETNKIAEFNDVKDIIDYFIKVRLAYYDKRKTYLIGEIAKRIQLNVSKFLFIKNVVDGNIVVNKKTRIQIETQIKKIKDIKPVDDNFDFLLRMPIYSLTREKYTELHQYIKKLSTEMKTLKKLTLNEMWLTDIKDLKAALRK